MKIGLFPRMFREYSLPGMRHSVEVTCAQQKKWTLFGGVDLATGETTLLTAPYGRTLEFTQFCDQLLAQYPEDTLHVIVDNSAVHNSREFNEYLKKNPRLNMVYLPTYSFYLNNIELLWLYARKTVCYNNQFQRLEWLVEEIMAFLNSLTKERILKAIGAPRKVDNNL
jgi:transposase